MATNLNVPAVKGGRANFVNILITGASGYVGHFLVNMLVKSPTFFIHCCTFRQGTDAVPVLHKNCRAILMDGTDEEAVNTAVQVAHPDIVVNCMAVAAPVECEKKQNHARKLNVPTYLIKSLRVHSPKALLIHLSTDMVYGSNNDAPHAEDAPCKPVNVYGQTKLEAEELIRREWQHHVILRASAIYGPVPKGRACTKLATGTFLQFVSVKMCQ